MSELPEALREAEERKFWARVRSAEDPNVCWEWMTAKGVVAGYGWLVMGRRAKYLAHRWAYTRWVGDIPVGYQIDHLCRTPACVNPAHLEAVTSRENTLRGIGVTAQNARKTHCRLGHPLDTRTNGDRWCYTCHLERMRRNCKRYYANQMARKRAALDAEATQ